MAAFANAAAGRTPEWPDHHARPDLRTFRGVVTRNLLLFTLFFVWVLGLGIYISLGGYTALFVLRSLVTAEALPLPAQGFLVFLALYWGYHLVTPHSVHKWPGMRVFSRHLNMDYPYFRLNATVFEELEADGVEQVLEENPKPVIKPNAKALFAFHPHGELTTGMAVNSAHHSSFAESECSWLVADSLFLFPVMRDILHWTNFGNVAKQTFVKLMTAGRNICLIPGGFEEATLYARGKHRVFLKSRFGFIKLGLQHGYKIHPVYTFGEEYLYHAFPFLLRWRLKMNELKVPGAVFFGRLWCFFMPLNDVDLITVIGKPLQLPTIEHPTREDVSKYHAQYVAALQAMFDKYKKKYAVDPDATLEIY